ncbi:SURF1 family protein [Oryzifoliimicrobium ureilyticus]|uniref:SURF1 family protein n=1 Tax=Oryzifoliimicrobium ureilyticus TaxID=3113724 RepID=UPI003F67E9B4
MNKLLDQTVPPIEKRSDRRSVLAVIGVIVGLVILLSLGTWQVERLHWKEGLLADIAARLAAEPVELKQIERLHEKGDDIEYRRMSVSGHFLNDRERHFFATWQGQTGFYVYTPLELQDGRYLFVNRGFVPYEKKLSQTRREGEVEGQITVTGLARNKLAGKPSWIVPDNDVAGDIFYWKDLDAMAASTGLEAARVIPFFLDADATPNPGGLPVGGVTQIDLPNNHLQYALTWYGLAAALAAMAAVSWFQRRRRAEP